MPLEEEQPKAEKPNYTYEVKLAADNPANTVILKRGITYEFPLSKMAEERAIVEKKRTEIQAQLSVESAKKFNIKEFHPKVLELDEKELLAAGMYAQAKQAEGDLLSELKDVEELLAEYDRQEADIEAQTGVKLPVLASQAPAEATNAE